MHEPRARIYTIVAMIPPGSVATYGQVARLAGLGRQARQVGYALAALDNDSALPWHRVVNACGEISLRAHAGAEQRQRSLLEREGVRFDDRGRISLEEFGWRP
jgi:methylated-DNA-protein-cysteine methyltransferase-like protein